MRDSPASGRRRNSCSGKGECVTEKDRLVLACELFERGFSEDRVEAAVARFSSLAEALQWLSPGSAPPASASASSSSSSCCRAASSPVVATARSSTVISTPTRTPTRRHSRKRPLADTQKAEDSSRDNAKKSRASQENEEASQSVGASSAAAPAAGSSADNAPKAAKTAHEPQGLQLSQGVEECTLCFLEVPAGQALRLSCRHGWYCVQCMVRHAEARLENGQVDIMCPQCRVSIPDFDLKEVLPQDIRERLQARSLAQAVSKASDLRHCPTPDCPMVVALEEGGEPRFQCPLCRRGSCLKCGAQPWHRGLTCEQHAEKKSSKADQSFVNWMKETGTRQCPTCGIAVTKQNIERQSTQYQECHKMMCRICNTRFCFKCGQVLTDKFSCGCSADAHQFIDPVTKRLVPHLKKLAKGRGAGRSQQQQAAARTAGRGRGRR